MKYLGVTLFISTGIHASKIHQPHSKEINIYVYANLHICMNNYVHVIYNIYVSKHIYLFYFKYEFVWI